MLTCLYKANSENLSPLYGDHCLQELLETLWSISREPLRLPQSLTRSGPSLAAARDYLHEHMSAKITLKQLVGLAGVSEFHFCRQFSRQFGLSPHAYQIQLRLLAAKRLLRNGHPIDAVYQAVGFSSQSHFTRAFLRVTGLTPARFQKTSKIVPNAVLS